MKILKLDPNKTVLTITVGFLVLHIIFSWYWALIVSLVVGVGGLFSQSVANGINFLWMKLTIILSLIVPNIIMALIFYLLLTPLAFMARIFKKEDELLLKGSQSSTFFNVNRKIDKNSLEKMW